MTDSLKFFARVVIHIEIWSVHQETRLFVTCESYLKITRRLLEFGQYSGSNFWLIAFFLDMLFAILFDEILTHGVVQILTAKMVIAIDSYGLQRVVSDFDDCYIESAATEIEH